MGAPADIMALSPVRPPVVDLGRLVGWDPLPLSVRDARRRAVDLRERLADVEPPEREAPADAAPVPLPEPAAPRPGLWAGCSAAVRPRPPRLPRSPVSSPGSRDSGCGTDGSSAARGDAVRRAG